MTQGYVHVVFYDLRKLTVFVLEYPLLKLIFSAQPTLVFYIKI